MVLAYHVIFGTYCFWLPNDPRGAWSNFVGSWELLRFGPATKTAVRQSVAAIPHHRRARLAAKRVLKHSPVVLSGRQALADAKGFDCACKEGEYVLHACSILPEHVHMVIRRNQRAIGRIMRHFKARATQKIANENLWTEEGRPVWAKRGWKVFLDKPSDVRRTISYVENNPLKEGKKRQQWTMITPFED